MAELDKFIRDLRGAVDAKRAATREAETAKLLEFRSSGEAPFFDDVLREMAALGRMDADMGREPPLKELYERACWASPSVRAVLLRRAVSEAKAAFLGDFVRALKELWSAKAKKRKAKR